MTQFNWLHFSDLHWGSKIKRYWGSVATKLIDDIAKIQDENNLKWDAIFFTGDLVNKGVEYDDFNENVLSFLEEEITKLGSAPLFFAVPGNHDLQRPQVKESDEWKDYDSFRKNWKANGSEKADFWDLDTSSPLRDFIKSRFENYEKWWKDKDRKFPIPDGIKAGFLPGDFAYQVKKDSIGIGIIGLNAAFCHLEDPKSEEILELNASQICHLCGTLNPKWFGKNQLNFLLTHHPKSWLTKTGESEYDNEIAPPGRFALHICGHQHEIKSENAYKNFYTEGQRILLSNSLFSREEIFKMQGRTKQSSVDRRHGYIAGSADLIENKWIIRIWPRKMNTSNVIVIDNDMNLKEGKQFSEFTWLIPANAIAGLNLTHILKKYENQRIKAKSDEKLEQFFIWEGKLHYLTFEAAVLCRDQSIDLRLLEDSEELIINNAPRGEDFTAEKMRSLLKIGSNVAQKAELRADEEIRVLVYEKIDQLLKDSAMAAFRESLWSNIDGSLKKGQARETADYAKLLIENPNILKTISLLSMAASDCIKSLQKRRVKLQVIDDTWDSIVLILGWLSIRAVNKDWIAANRDKIESGKVCIRFSVPARTKPGRAIAISALLRIPAKFKIEGNKFSDPLSDYELDLEFLDGLETGFDALDRVTHWKHALWKYLNESEPPEIFGDDENIELNNFIEALNEKKSVYYLYISPKSNDERLNDLMHDLPALKIIETDASKIASAFLVDEGEIHARLKAFFRNQPKGGYR